MVFMVGKSSAVRTFKKWLTLGLKNGRTFGLCTTWKNRSRWVVARRFCKFSAHDSAQVRALDARTHFQNRLISSRLFRYGPGTQQCPSIQRYLPNNRKIGKSDVRQHCKPLEMILKKTASKHIKYAQ